MTSPLKLVVNPLWGHFITNFYNILSEKCMSIELFCFLSLVLVVYILKWGEQKNKIKNKINLGILKKGMMKDVL